MYNPTAAIIRQCIHCLQMGYRRIYGDRHSEYSTLIAKAATITLEAIARSDALYHNIEHTILVTLVGQEILYGKQQQEGNVSCQEWAHFIISLLCHDIGYVKGICQQDKGEHRIYATGIADEQITIAPGATDASLTPHHIDRSKQFVQENFASYSQLDVATIQHNIEFTRFPVPQAELYRDTTGYAGLTRAADLIGQFSDPRYLEKIPALFFEFEEVGTNQTLGYRHPGDLRAGYPKFFRHAVYPYIQPALHYLKATPKGRQVITDLYTHVFTVEQESLPPSKPNCPTPSCFHPLPC